MQAEWEESLLHVHGAVSWHWATAVVMKHLEEPSQRQRKQNVGHNVSEGAGPALELQGWPRETTGENGPATAALYGDSRLGWVTS